MKLVSQKYNNVQYAPGIPLYGIDGRDGQSGQNGSSLFISQFDISNAESLKNFGNCIRQGKMPVAGSSKFIGRNYINGDTFLFPDRQLYKIIDITGLSSVADHLTTDSFEKYFESVGEIVLSSTDGDTFEPYDSNGRKVLNSEDYKGFVINTSELPDTDINNIESPFTIISDTTESDGKIRFLDMKAILSGQNDAQLSIYYDSNNQCYVIESNQQIIIDGDLKTTQSGITDYDEFSGVLTNDNTITSLKGVCSKLSWNIPADLPSSDSKYFEKSGHFSKPVFNSQSETFEVYRESDVIGRFEETITDNVHNYHIRSYNMYPEDGRKYKKVRLYAYYYDIDPSFVNWTLAFKFQTANDIIIGNYHYLSPDDDTEMEPQSWSDTAGRKIYISKREYTVPDNADILKVCYPTDKFCYIEVSGDFEIPVEGHGEEEQERFDKLGAYPVDTLSHGYLKYYTRFIISNENNSYGAIPENTMIHIIGTNPDTFAVENEYFVRINEEHPINEPILVESTEAFVEGIKWKVSLIDSVEFELKEK